VLHYLDFFPEVRCRLNTEEADMKALTLWSRMNESEEKVEVVRDNERREHKFLYGYKGPQTTNQPKG
jgi:hypothetical protein